MKPALTKAFAYQDDNMALPVADVGLAAPFYEKVFGFHVVSRSDTPHRSVILARDEVQMGLEENGGDPGQDGCAFHVVGLDDLHAEFKANGVGKLGAISTEQRDGAPWRVFFVIAPDGLCFWFGEKQGS